MENSSMTYKVVRAALVVVLVLIIFAFGVWFYFIHTLQATTGPNASINNVLTNSNAYFAEGEQMGHLIGYIPTTTDKRVDLYRQALLQTTDVRQQGQIKYKIAMAEIQKGDYLSALPLLKEVAANTEYSRYTRAYSVEELGDIFYIFHDPSITKIIFADPPYDSMVMPGDATLTYRHLYEYASSFRPLAGSEVRIADWDAKNIVDQYAGGQKPPMSVIQPELDDLNAHLKRARADMVRTQTNPNARVSTPDALERIGVIDGELAQVGLSTNQEAEDAFQEARRVSVEFLGGYVSPYWYFHYSVFLNTAYASKDIQKIRDNLNKIYGGVYASQSRIMVFLQNERQHDTTNIRPQVVSLAKVDPSFKQLLMSLGWTESDFN